MKTLIITLSTLTILSSFGIIAESENFKWNKTDYDFGEIELNQPVTASFSFENSSDHTVKITQAKASCGCTVASYTTGEISPGQSGTVTATYNAAKAGVFKKSISIQTNTLENFTLYISGEVLD
ncbi:MAG: DUF1573 domain-containing protein [Reichenbachiella sp.]